MLKKEKMIIKIIDEMWDQELDSVLYPQARLLELRTQISHETPESKNAYHYINVLDAYFMYRENKVNEALELALLASDAFSETSFVSGKLRVLRVLCLIYARIGRMFESINAAREALTLIKSHQICLTEGKGLDIQFSFLNNLATVYTYLNRDAEAADCYKLALEMVPAEQLRPYLVAKSNLGAAYVEMGNHEVGLNLIESSLKEACQNHLENQFIQMCHHGIGRAYRRSGDLARGLEHFEIAKSLAVEGGHEFSLLELMIEIIKTKMALNPKEALDALFEDSLLLAHCLASQNLLCQIFELKAQYHENGGAYAEALVNYKKFFELWKNIASKETENLMSIMSIERQLENAKNETEIFKIKANALEQERQDLSKLSEIGRDITSALSFDRLSQKTFENLSGLMNVCAFTVALFDEMKNQLHFMLNEINGKICTDETHRKIEIGDIEEICISQREPICVVGKNLNEASALYQPLIYEDQVIGLIKVESMQKDAFGEREMELIKIIAAYVAIALNNARKSEDLKVAVRELTLLSATDPLTGAYNRRYILDQLSNTQALYNQNKRPFSILIIDIDHFKNINDTYGHDVGDAVIKCFSEIMTKLLRSQDILARWGGEEFLILMPETLKEEAYSIAERIRLEISKTVIHRGGVSVKTTITIGVAESSDGVSIDELIHHADLMLYEGKRAGRNLISVYS